MASRITAAIHGLGTTILQSCRHTSHTGSWATQVCRYRDTTGSLRWIYSGGPDFEAKKQEVEHGPEEPGMHAGESESQRVNGEYPRESQSASTTEVHAQPSEETTTTDHMAEQAVRVERLQKGLAERDDKILQLQDKTLRVLAEMENVRTIAQRDVDNAKRYGISGFAKSLLTVADHLGLALQAVDPEKIGQGNELLKGLFEGVQATEKELQKTFASHGIIRFGKKGDIFDPNLHQAMFETNVPDTESGRIVSVTKTGYTIGDRILRPAEVGVNKTG